LRHNNLRPDKWPQTFQRLAVGSVPWWQPWLAAAVMVLTAVIIVRTVVKMFQTQTLLSGQPFSARRYIPELIGRKHN